MVFIPPFGMINPIPTVNHNDFQGWLSGYQRRKQPVVATIFRGKGPKILIGYAPTGVVRNSLRLFLATSAGAYIAYTWQNIVYPGRRPAPTINPDISETIDDINRYIRELVKTANNGRGPKGPKPKKHEIPAPFADNKNRPNPFAEPFVAPWKEILRPMPRKTDRDEPENSFFSWLERRYGRKHPAKYMRRRRF